MPRCLHQNSVKTCFNTYSSETNPRWASSGIWQWVRTWSSKAWYRLTMSGNLFCLKDIKQAPPVLTHCHVIESDVVPFVLVFTSHGRTKKHKQRPGPWDQWSPHGLRPQVFGHHLTPRMSRARSRKREVEDFGPGTKLTWSIYSFFVSFRR